jgi:simple sugar transport system permease protein
MSRYWFLGVNLLVLLVMLVSPWGVPMREFDGSSYMLNPLGVINPVGLTLPPISLGWLIPVVWLWVALLVAAGAALFLPEGRNRARVLYILGGVGIVLFALEAVLFYQAVDAANHAAVAAGARRPPLRRFSLSLGAYLELFYALGLLLLARLQLPGGRAFLVRYRGGIVPLVALVLAIAIGAVVVAVLRPGLGLANAQNVGLRDFLAAKLDLVTYTYQILFSPVLSLTGIFSSLSFATPLIFAGLAVAFGFQAGLFNIGGPGQITLGAVAAMLAGVYIPGPAWVVLPLAILAAMAGGALWAGIAGWLKARFGANEVINTIMLNYIAASVLLFLIANNTYKFFGHTVTLPFKAPGFEGRSAEIQPGARIPQIIDLLVPGGHFSWALPLAVLAGIGVYAGLRRLELGRRLLVAAGAVIVGYLLGAVLPGFAVKVSSDLSSILLNGSFLLAVVGLLFYNFFLFRTSSGYELRATGLAPRAAEYAGVNLNRKIVVAMLISGALAGLVATHYVLGGGVDGTYRLKQSLPTDAGFFGIAIALMGQNTPLGIFLASALFGVLLSGATTLNVQLGISRDLVTVLQALIIMFIAVGGLLPRYFTDPLRAAQVETEDRARRDEQAAKTAKVAGD